MSAAPVFDIYSAFERSIPTPEQLVTRAPAKPAWLIADLIPEQSVTLLAGAPASFKWWFAWDIARHVAGGVPWLALAVTPAPVLYIDLENPTALCVERFRTWPTMGGRIHYWGKWQQPDFAQAPELAGPQFCRLAEKAARAGPDDYDLASGLLYDYARGRRPLMIFDSLIRLHPENESDNQRMAPIMRCFDHLAQAGATVIVLHHLSHAGDPRGASEIQCAPDVVYKVRREQLRADLISEKNRYTPETATPLLWTPKGFQRRAGPLIDAPRGRPRSKRAGEPTQAGLF